MKSLSKYRMKLLIVFSLTLMNFNSYGQKSISKTDSLLVVLAKEKPDTNKVMTYSLVCKQYRIKEKFDLAKMYADSALALSIKLNFYKGQAIAYNSKGIICRRLNDYMEAIKNYNAARSIYQQIGYKKGVAAANSNIGNVYLDQGNYEEALKYFFTSLKIKQEDGDSMNLDFPVTIQNIGNIYYLTGNYPVALKYYYRALKLNEKIGDNTGIGETYNNLGNIYDSQANFPEALKNYSAALKSAMHNENKEGIAGAYLNMGIVYKHQGNFQDALKNYFSALSIGHEIGNKFVIIEASNNIGNVYALIGKQEDALKYYSNGLETAEEIGANAGISESCLGIGNLLTQENKFNEARKYLERGMTLAKEVGSKEDLKSGYKILSVLDSANGFFDRALFDYKMFILYNDSLVNEGNTKKMVQSQMQYDFDKKTAADSIRNVEQKKRDDLKHDNEIQQQKTYTYGGIFGFILMLVVAGVSFRAFRQKQKTNTIITMQKEIVEEKQKAIMDSIRYAKKIQRSMLPTEKYIQKNLTRLKNKS